MENILLSYAEDLNDAYPGHEFSIWPRHKLLEYLNEALCLIAAQRPDLFTEIKVVKVDPCSNYLDLCECNEILDVLGQSDKNGRLIRALPERSKKGTLWTGGSRFQDTFATELSEYEIIDRSNLVRVYPQNLDPTKDIYVLIRCSVDAKTYTLDDEPPSGRCAFMAAARHFVMYSAKMIDGEFSPAMLSASKEHREMFFGILQMSEAADEKATDETAKYREQNRRRTQ